MKVFFDSLISTYSVLSSIIRYFEGGEVTIIALAGDPADAMEGHVSITAFIVEAMRRGGRHWQNTNIHWLSPSLRTFRKSFHYGMIREMFKWFKGPLAGFRWSKRVGQKRIIILDHRYDVKAWTDSSPEGMDFYKISLFPHLILIKSLYSANFKLVCARGDDGRKHEIEKIFRGLAEEMAGHPVFRGIIELSNLALLCLERHLRYSLRGGVVEQARAIQRLLEKTRPALVCTAACRMNVRDALITAVARSMGVPVITYQEGGGAGYLDWPLFNVDTELSDHFLVYGRGVAESPFVKKGRASIHPVGSLYLGCLISNDDASKRNGKDGIYVILDNIKTGTWQHYPYNGGFFSRAYAHQSKIISLLQELGAERFILKTIKGRENLYYGVFGKEGGFRIETKPLGSILKRASAFILDYPSTVLQECLLTDKPIALLLDSEHVRFEPKALELLLRRVRIALHEADYPKVLKELMRDVESGSSMTLNKDFLETYCRPERDPQNISKLISDIANFHQKGQLRSP